MKNNSITVIGKLRRRKVCAACYHLSLRDGKSETQLHAHKHVYIEKGELTKINTKNRFYRKRKRKLG
jgi:hypothetical protein